MAQGDLHELQTRIERLQAIADNLPAIIAYWDNQERCQFSNQACLEWFGLSPSSMLGERMRDVLGDAVYARSKPFVDAVLRGERQSFERDLVDATGVTRNTQTSYIPDFRDGAVQGFFVLISETSERKRAEAAALESRAQLQALLDAVPDYISSLDREGKIIFANRTMERPIEMVLGRPVQQFFPEAQRELARQRIEAAFVNGSSSTFEAAVSVAGGTRWFNCQIRPVLREGKTTSALLISRDITERRRMETQLISSERLAAVGALAAGVAHEINTPVQFVMDSVHFLGEGSAELMRVLDKLLALQRAGDDPNERTRLLAEAQASIEDADLEYLLHSMPKAIERSLNGLKRVAEIVRSLKAFSHLDQKEMVEASLEQLIDDALTLASNEYKHVAAVVRDYSSGLTVQCHTGGISQVILNLLVNAAHAIGDRFAGQSELGRITIRTLDQGDSALISISDTGAGIPEAIRPRIFTPFFTTKTVGKGTGQGLAISWNIITKEHHGDIWFESEVGVGTTFHVRIPKDRKHCESHSSPSAATPQLVDAPGLS